MFSFIKYFSCMIIILNAKAETYFNSSDIVVTATKSSRVLADTPIKTEVFAREQLEDFKPRDIAEALKYLPGISLQNLHSRNGQAPIIQGLGEKHTLILLNGIAQTQISSSGYDLSQLDVSSVERIEVIKGASSSLYGSQAMGGVINIITKKKDNSFILNLRNEFNLNGDNTTVLNRGNTLGSLQWSGSKDKWNWIMNASRRTSENFDLDTSSIVQDGRDQEIRNYLVGVGHDFGKHSGYFEYRFIDDYSQDQGSVLSGTRYAARINTIKQESHNIQYSHKFKLDEDLLQTNIQYSKIDDDYNILDNPETSFIESRALGVYENLWLELQYDIALGLYQNLTMGLVVKQDYLDKKSFNQSDAENSLISNEVDQKKQKSLELYVQDDILLGDWEIVPGIRGNYTEGYSADIAPKLSLSYAHSTQGGIESIFRASVARGYRVPDLKEKYFFLNHSSIGNYVVEGNQNLKPEESLSYQIGSELTFNKDITFHGNFFLNEVKNLISYSDGITRGANTVYSYQNIGRVQTRGFEFSSQFSVSKYFYNQLSYTYSRAVNKRNNLFLTNRPFYFIQNSMIFKMNSILKNKSSITIDTLFRDSEYTTEDNTKVSKGFLQWDILFNYAFHEKGELYFGVDNIFNVMRNARLDGQDSNELDLKPALGRYVFLGIKFKG